MVTTKTLSFLTYYLFSIVFTSSAASDGQALLAFKAKADLYNHLYWFNSSVSHCHWLGVQCFHKTTRVYKLVVQDLPLYDGVFAPDSLTRLTQLRVLSLRNNSLVGPIPDLSSLVNLKAIYLHHNHFSGHFPPSITLLHRIRTVDFSYNNLTGELPAELTELDRLYYFRVEFNRLNGSIPPFNQSTLSNFNVSNNQLMGPVPVTAILSKLSLTSFTPNRGLCGEIVKKECHHKPPFFNTVTVPSPSPTSSSSSSSGGGVESSHEGHSHTHHHHRTTIVAVILGFSVGVFVLIMSVICFAMAVRKRKESYSISYPVSGDMSAAAEAVMRTEEEREEKVKSAQLQVDQHNNNNKVVSVSVSGELSKSGSLLFCAGEPQVYTLDQLMRASAELLGRGSVGTTYKAVLDNRLIVCVKRLDASKIGGVGKEVFQRHMESVGALRHPNLVPLRAFFEAKDERLLVYDYQPNGSLLSLIHGSKSARAKPLHWTSCLKIAEDIAQGLSYIHQAWRLVHGNLKSSNVLLGSDFEACLTDYCLNVLTENTPSPEIDPDSYGYKSPEIRKSGSQATSKSDVYAFGVLLLELLTSKPPSQHPFFTPNEIVRWVRLARDVDDASTDENRLAMLLEVAIACSMASPEQRPNMFQVLKMLQEIKEAVFMEENEMEPCEGID